MIYITKKSFNQLLWILAKPDRFIILSYWLHFMLIFKFKRIKIIDLDSMKFFLIIRDNFAIFSYLIYNRFLAAWSQKSPLKPSAHKQTIKNSFIIIHFPLFLHEFVLHLFVLIEISHNEPWNSLLHKHLKLWLSNVMQVPLFLHGLSKQVIPLTEQNCPEKPLAHEQENRFGFRLFSEQIPLFWQGFDSQAELRTVDLIAVVVVTKKVVFIFKVEVGWFVTGIVVKIEFVEFEDRLVEVSFEAM